MRIKTTALLASICLSIPPHALALCLEPPRPCSWYAVRHGQPTFIGTVTSEKTVPDVLDLGGHEIRVTVEKATFNVEESFDGESSKTETVFGEGTTNDFHFNVGERYLVYGFRGKDGRIRTAKCTRTAPASKAAEDMRFLRSLPTHDGGDIFGLVRFVSQGLQVGTVTGTITESGKDGDHKTRVSDSGLYELTGLALGNYRETFTPDETGTEFLSLRVTIPVNGSCAESGVRLGNVTVSGIVIDETGKPVADTDVLLFYALDGRFHPDVLVKTRTDARGIFSFHRVEAAKFILAAQLANSGMAFFPGTRDASKAHVIETQDGTPVSGLTIRIPPFIAD
jgi:hypothetical protein